MAGSKELFTLRLEQKIIDVQLLKTLRYFLLGEVQDYNLLNCVKYFIYDYFYIIKNKNFKKFKSTQKNIVHIKPNVTYLVLIVGSRNGNLGPFNLIINGDKNDYVEKEQSTFVNMGDVVEVKSTKNLYCFSDAMLIGWEVEESENLDDWLEIDRFIHLVSKPSWTNHFSASS